jgi:hypothetical protein
LSESRESTDLKVGEVFVGNAAQGFDLVQDLRGTVGGTVCEGEFELAQHPSDRASQIRLAERQCA